MEETGRAGPAQGICRCRWHNDLCRSWHVTPSQYICLTACTRPTTGTARLSGNLFQAGRVNLFVKTRPS